MRTSPIQFFSNIPYLRRKPQSGATTSAHCTEKHHQCPFANPLKWTYLVAALCSIPPLSAQAQDKQPPASETMPAGAPFWQIQEAEHMTLLAEDIDEQAIFWLDTNSGEPSRAMVQPSPNHFLAIYEREYTEQPVGALLLLHAQGQHPSWQGGQKLLLETLPEFGWNTLAISLPKLGYQPPPDRPAPQTPAPAKSTETDEQPEEQEEQEEQTAPDTNNTGADERENKTEEETENKTDKKTNSEGMTKPRERPQITQHLIKPELAESTALKRIKASMSFLNSQGQFNNAALAYGAAGARLTDYLSELPIVEDEFPIRALILVNARNIAPGGKKDLSRLSLPPQLPILDIISGDNSLVQHDAEQRHKRAKRNQWRNYTQIRLPRLSETEQTLTTTMINRRIRGFLEVNAKGVRVDNATVN